MKTTKTARNKEVAGSTIPLSKPEAARLSELEEKIDSGLKTFLEVGRALKEIKELKLYRAAAGSFEKYVQQRFKIGRAQAYRLIDEVQIDERLQVSPIGDKRPVNESQFRALACVDENHLCEVWQKAVETANKSGKPVSAKLVKEEIIKKHTEPTVEQVPDPEEIVDEVEKIEEEQRSKRFAIGITKRSSHSAAPSSSNLRMMFQRYLGLKIVVELNRPSRPLDLD